MMQTISKNHATTHLQKLPEITVENISNTVFRQCDSCRWQFIEWLLLGIISSVEYR